MVKIRLLLILLWGLWPCIAGAQVKPRVEGLSGNAEYMQLLERESEMSARIDSLTGVITRLREEFRTNAGDRRTFADRIVGLENEVFELRDRAGSVAVQIRKIEEAFILNNLNGGEARGGGPAVETGEQQSANLVRNDVFLKLLPGEDHAALLRAQAGERSIADLLAKYRENHALAADLAMEYANAENAVTADSIFASPLALERANADIADSLADAWNEIFDNKLFAYNYLLQTQNKSHLLARMEAAARDTRDEIARQRANAASEEIVAYFEQKELVFEYEKAIAEMFGLGAAADSLRSAADAFRLLKLPLPNIKIEERLFIEYADIAAHNPAKYNASNPIPEVEVYRRGLIYRIVLNSYKVQQVVSIFKGLAPLAYSREGGQWSYYAGGFVDFAAAGSALENMKKRGFRNARIVVWNDGERLVLDEKPAAGASWRVEIAASQISDEVRKAISAADNGVDISRSGDLFIIGPFATPFEAEKVADATRKADPSLKVRNVQIDN